VPISNSKAIGQPTNQMLLVFFNKAIWLSNINFFFEISMQKHKIALVLNQLLLSTPNSSEQPEKMFH
jgi:hypothetical protein